MTEQSQEGKNELITTDNELGEKLKEREKKVRYMSKLKKTVIFKKQQFIIYSYLI